MTNEPVALRKAHSQDAVLRRRSGSVHSPRASQHGDRVSCALQARDFSRFMLVRAWERGASLHTPLLPHSMTDDSWYPERRVLEY